MSAYSKLEMCISKTPWVKVLWDADNHTMIMKHKTLVHSLLIYMFDKTLLNKNETNSLRKRYAKILDVDIMKIDGMLEVL